MLSLEQAQEKILSQIQLLPAEVVPLSSAGGRYLRQEVASSVDLPPFDNSAMDGFAVRAEDLAGASPSNPVELKVIGRIGAGETYNGSLRSGESVRLFTGSPLPLDSDAVVMQEDVDNRGATAVFREPIKPLENIRLRGEDLRVGSVLGQVGQLVTAPLVGLLSAGGVPHVSVGKRPCVALLATGNELREPGTILNPGEIYESNRAMLAECVRAMGGTPQILPLVPDDLEATKKSLCEALSGADAVITSGGVSVGEFDFVKTAIEELGGTLEFWRVAIKPGKPFVLGKCQGKWVFGLPGNPVSAFVTFLLLVRPALLRMQGARACFLPRVHGVMTERVRNAGNRRHFVRAHLSVEGKVSIAGPQASHMLGNLGQANGLVDVPPEGTIEKGQEVSVHLWDAPAG